MREDARMVRGQCAKCDAPTNLVHNSFYGTGLSTCPSFWLCTRCGWTLFLHRNLETVQDDGPEDNTLNARLLRWLTTVLQP